ncbi:hypothetical protein, partial [Paenibacillus sp.]|uniref:hypothetical protein n=1 Tax=Paenibacillus sp. TaxID=58172 RepID=UPI0028374F69
PSGQVSCVDISQDGFRIAVGLAISGASDRVIAYSVNNTKTVFTRNTIAGNIKGAPACISFVGPTYDFAVGSINIASGSGGEMAVFSGSADTYKLTSIDYTSLYISSCCSTTDGKFIIFTLGGTASGTNNINVLETANMYKGNPKITTNKTAYMVCFNKQNSAFAFYTDSTDGIQVWGYTPSTESFFYKGSFTGYDAANGAQPSFSYYDLVVYPGYNGTNTRSLGMDLTFSKNQDMDMYSPYDRMLGFVKEAGIANDVKHKITGISRRKGDIK